MIDKSKQNMVKARLLVLTKMFYELTDENHPMDTFKILDYLAENGVPANNKTLRSDIALLKELEKSGILKLDTDEQKNLLIRII